MKNIRVRFAPSPTGKMHLGNIRMALLNFLFAKQKNGTFILRIEDTDLERNMDHGEKKIIEDLNFLGLTYDEGPICEGPHKPYLQSERQHIYQEKLEELIRTQKVYRCFCSQELLEEKKKKQIEKGLPPRYDKTCATLSEDMIKQKLKVNLPFVWRLAINQDAIIEVKNMDRGIMRFELKNFPDFALTRPDGTFTFLFVNFVDDWLMKITHVIRGEDHLSNSAMQGALFDAFAVMMPTYWHLPMICNQDGKILSKRDYGSSLDDLIQEGFLPHAILNYLGSWGTSLNPEIQSLEELVSNYNFENLHSSGPIKYDVEKLKWFNHKWINLIEEKELLKFVKPFLSESFPESIKIPTEKLIYLINKVKTNAQTLKDFSNFLDFYFEKPKTNKQTIIEFLGEEKASTVLDLITEGINKTDNPDFFLENLKLKAKELNLKLKEVFGTLRYILTGKLEGIGSHDLLNILDWDEIKNRLNDYTS